MTRWLILAALGALLLFVGGAWLNREALVLTYFGGRIDKRSLAEQQALIAPFIHVFAPDAGAPPYPAVIQFHGCAGYRADFMEMWAQRANDAGFLVIAVDSNSPRGFDREAALSSVCKGKALLGQERAGDVVAALAVAAEREDVDPARIVLAGWSHGAWAVMDYLALTAAGRRPPSVRGAAPAVDPAAVVLFYPYCGEGTWSRIAPWAPGPGVLAFVAGKDTVVDGGACMAQFEKLRGDGIAVDLVHYENADHVFDDQGLVGGPYEKFYSAPEAADAARRYRRFLTAISDHP